MSNTITVDSSLIVTVTRNSDSFYFNLTHDPLTMEPFRNAAHAEVIAMQVMEMPNVFNAPPVEE